MLLMGKSTISTGPFSIAMLVHQRVQQDFYGYLEGLGTSRSRQPRYSSPAFRQRALRHWGYAILPCIAPARRMVRPVPENHKDLRMSYQDT